MGRLRGRSRIVVILLLLGAFAIGAGYVATTQLNENATSDRADELAVALSGDDGISGAPPPTAAQPLTTEELARQFRDAVYRVDTEGCGFESGGTAFAVAEHLLITNWHVVVTDTAPVLVAQDGRAAERRGPRLVTGAGHRRTEGRRIPGDPAAVGRNRGSGRGPGDHRHGLSGGRLRP